MVLMQIRYEISFCVIPPGLKFVKRIDAMECVLFRLGANENKVPVARGLRHRRPPRGHRGINHARKSARGRALSPKNSSTRRDVTKQRMVLDDNNSFLFYPRPVELDPLADVGGRAIVQVTIVPTGEFD
jgi:hypothetical protein